MKKNILFLSCYKSVYGGNFIPSLLYLESELKKIEVNVCYCFPVEAKERLWIKEISDKTIVFIDFNQSLPSFLYSLKEVVHENHITAIHSHHVNALLMDLYSYVDLKTKVYIHLHSDFTSGNSSRIKRFKDFLVYRLLASRVKMFSVSQAFVSLNSSKITWIPNCLAHFSNDTNKKLALELRKSIGATSSDVVCEIFGWTPYVKGLDVAVEAVKKANRESKRNIILIVVCGREMTPSRIKSWINNNTSCIGDESFLVYLEPREDVYTIHEAADILLSASRSEGFPYSILEALSIGMYVVSSDIPGVSWTFKYEIVSRFQSENICECTDALLRVVDRLTCKDSSVKEKVISDYSITKWTSMVIKGYDL